MSTEYRVETSVGPLSGRIAGPTDHPRGLVVALHGGTYYSAYFDTGEGSLLSVAPDLGLCVVALDRPGYGVSAGLDPQNFTFAAQEEILTEAITESIATIRPTDGTVLIGHSIGGMIALGIVAGGLDVKGVEVSGIGVRWNPGMVEMWSSFISDAPSIEVPAEPHAQVMLGPEGTYTDEQRATDAALLRPMPMPELTDVVQWAERFPDVAGRITTPVSITFAEHDNIWASDPAARTAAADLFRAAASVRLDHVTGAGHCIELHRPARSYCLRQLAFVEASLAG